MSRPFPPDIKPAGRKIFRAAPLFFVLLTPWPGFSLPPQSSVALVNGVPITGASLGCAMDANAVRSIAGTWIAGGHRGKTIDDMRKLALDRLIDLELLYQEGIKCRFPDLPAEVERRFQMEVKGLGGAGTMDFALECSQMTEQDLKMKILRWLTINRYLEQEVYSRIAITEDQVRDYYRGHNALFQTPSEARLQHILVKVESWHDPGSVAAGREKMDGILSAARSGVDFASLARRHSDDPLSAVRGGEWGFVQKGILGENFDSVIFSLPPGQVGTPVTSRLGFHLVRVLEVRPPSTRSLEEVRGEIVSRLRQKEAGSRVKELLERLRQKARIKVFLP